MQNTDVALQPQVGQYVRPNDSFAYRPWCLVTEVIQDDSRSYLGYGFIADYPNGTRALQWEGDDNARFNEIRG